MLRCAALVGPSRELLIFEGGVLGARVCVRGAEKDRSAPAAVWAEGPCEGWTPSIGEGSLAGGCTEGAFALSSVSESDMPFSAPGAACCDTKRLA